ncbi:uncharacterized protein LY89DRAFT_28511 [Mollisia scopiformis]|uniref:Uncharacterized protein n=1 Tax=Mollisia scopiformis TaxID=149040 RepID=A0A194XDL8_MOLSC|nr:uncharacterized protein LY89DRAFT_28511 [Mollisia scopiformis]KUJ17847.1 hypothetical protein LY89DRAFT_28511 [Mollisia scopiformis]
MPFPSSQYRPLSQSLPSNLRPSRSQIPADIPAPSPVLCLSVSPVDSILLLRIHDSSSPPNTLSRRHEVENIESRLNVPNIHIVVGLLVVGIPYGVTSANSLLFFLAAVLQTDSAMATRWFCAVLMHMLLGPTTEEWDTMKGNLAEMLLEHCCTGGLRRITSKTWVRFRFSSNVMAGFPSKVFSLPKAPTILNYRTEIQLRMASRVSG